MQVLIADSLVSAAVEELESMGCVVRNEPSLTADDLPRAIAGVNVLIVRSTKVTSAVFEAADSLALVVRAGAGVNTIDLEAADHSGVFVANCPGKNAHAVAELALGLIIAADRGIAGATADLGAGRWRKKHYGAAAGLRGRILGILGYGTIGQILAGYGAALGMKRLVWSRSLTPERAEAEGVQFAASPLDVAQNADVVTLHLAANSETRGLINAEFLQAIKEGAILVNTSRGEIVDQEALAAAIPKKNLRVALDVYDGEPGGGEAEWTPAGLTCPGGPVPGDGASSAAGAGSSAQAADATGNQAPALRAATPHIGASTAQASDAIAAEAVRIVRVFKETGVPVNAVNVGESGRAQYTLVVRHRNRVGVLAGVLDSLRENNVNVEEMTNTIFQRGETASCSLRLAGEPDSATLERIRGQEHVLAVRGERA
jgi:D-3-phosphoglycerate dehydrogenase